MLHADYSHTWPNMLFNTLSWTILAWTSSSTQFLWTELVAKLEACISVVQVPRHIVSRFLVAASSVRYKTSRVGFRPIFFLLSFCTASAMLDQPHLVQIKSTVLIKCHLKVFDTLPAPLSPSASFRQGDVPFQADSFWKRGEKLPEQWVCFHYYLPLPTLMQVDAGLLLHQRKLPHVGSPRA